MSDTAFKKIAVIGSGTMGSAIAGQIANAGHPVLLLDLPAREGQDKSPAEAAIDRLLASDPPALMHKNRAKLIATGDIENDFELLADCDWIIEAIVERLPLKKALYQRLDAVIKPDCIVTSNTSTIPIKLLVEDMPSSFRQRFAITHYFNPVRYMRLLELVSGEESAPAIIDKLAAFNDQALGKGVVVCADTPGFLGNRVGVFALQVGLDEAARQGLDIEDADALAGRPLGIPKTGVFGLYDLIGVDLMSDVVDTLEDILPAGDAFFEVGKKGPVRALISTMIAEGYTGAKSGKGGFFRRDSDGAKQAIDLTTGALRPLKEGLPLKAQRAAALTAEGGEPLEALIAPLDNSEAEALATRFCRRYLARVLAYAASLIPAVTRSPQDIDDALKLGFNWQRGPFEMMDAIGAARLNPMIEEAGLEIPEVLRSGQPFYQPAGGQLTVRVDGSFAPIKLPENTIRFSMLRRALTPIKTNAAASLWALGDDLRLVEFHSKANALTGQSMEIVRAAAQDHGRGVLVHNDAQHFSAGVDLNAFRRLIEAQDWSGIDAFLADFQQSVAALKACPVPVVGAPSGLALGGGFEVLAHCDKLVCHANSVLGLVECGVGLVPGGGGVKEAMARWLDATDGDAEEAAWQAWMQLGYSKTGSSPEMAAKLQYFLPERDESVMNRDKLIHQASLAIEELAPGYQAPAARTLTLPGRGILARMEAFMDEGIAKGWFYPHDKTTAMAIASIVVNTEADAPLVVSEQDMYDRERAAFIHLAQTPETLARITALLDEGRSLRN